MSAAIIGLVSSAFTGMLSLVGVIYASNKNNTELNNSVNNQLQTHQVVTDEKIDNLTKEIKRLTESIAIIPELRTQIELLKRDVEDLKRKVG